MAASMTAIHSCIARRSANTCVVVHKGIQLITLNQEEICSHTILQLILLIKFTL